MNHRNNFFFDRDQFKIIDIKRIIYLLISVFCFILTETGRFFYRPFIYQNNINDFGIADSIGNSGGIMVQIFFSLAILNSTYKKGFRIIGFLVMGYIIYEIAQPYLPKGTFDWLDIYGTLIGGIISLCLYVLIHKLIKQNKIYYNFN